MSGLSRSTPVGSLTLLVTDITSGFSVTINWHSNHRCAGWLIEVRVQQKGTHIEHNSDSCGKKLFREGAFSTRPLQLPSSVRS